MERRTFLATATAALAPAATRETQVTLEDARFLINGSPTYQGRQWRGHRIEGLLFNSRMANGIFDDRNPATAGNWKYPDTDAWDPNRNTAEFVAAMPDWRKHGLLSFTISMQGGNPQGYSPQQPWVTGAFQPNGDIIPAYLNRLRRVLDKADELGMAPIVSVFYFGQDQVLESERAVRRALRNTIDFILTREYRNVLLEVANECNNGKYDQPLLRPDLIPLLLRDAREVVVKRQRLQVGVSWSGGTLPTPEAAAASDFLLLHGNGVKDPGRLADMVRRTRKLPGYRPKPILFNEDDHFDFDRPANNLVAAISEYASWGFLDIGVNNYRDGFQSPPVQWGINTERKQAFFGLLQEITGAQPTPL